MMLCLLALIVVLAVHSLTLDGAMEGVKFLFGTDFAAMKEIGIGNVIFGALSRAFFTLSIGAGSMTIFRKLSGEEPIPSGRVHPHYHSGHLCSLDGRIDHYPSVLLLRSRAAAGPGGCIYYIAKCV